MPQLARSKSSHSSCIPGANEGFSGVFDTDIGQTLYLFVDVKTDGLTTFPAVIKALQPLRDAGYLSNVTNGKFNSGPVTVIGLVL